MMKRSSPRRPSRDRNNISSDQTDKNDRAAKERRKEKEREKERGKSRGEVDRDTVTTVTTMIGSSGWSFRAAGAATAAAIAAALTGVVFLGHKEHDHESPRPTTLTLTRRARLGIGSVRRYVAPRVRQVRLHNRTEIPRRPDTGGARPGPPSAAGSIK